MLPPDGGHVLLGDEDVTGLEPAQRVKRGLARTFQINTLFPVLSPLEAVTLAVCERAGVAAHVVARARPPTGARSTRRTAFSRSLALDAVCHRPTGELPYGQQRLLEIALALATRPRVLLLDEPAAGVPRDESAGLFAAVAGLSQDLTVLFIEHDMDVVFRFASRVIVMVGGQILVEGTPSEIAADRRVQEIYLGGGRHG